MHAVFISFRATSAATAMPGQIERHIAKLASMPDVMESHSLRNGRCRALFLLFRNGSAAKSCLASEAMRALSSGVICWDVFVDYYEMAEPAIEPEPAQIDSGVLVSEAPASAAMWAE